MTRSADLAAWLDERLELIGHTSPGLPPRPERAVVAFDGGTRSLRAAAWAAQLADEVHAVTAVSRYHLSPTGPLARREALDWGTGVRATAEAALPKLVEILGDVHVEHHEITASPVNALVETCRELEPDLLLLGTQNRGWLDRAALGSVSEAMLHHAGVTTLLAAQAPGDGPVLGAVGDDAASPLAAAWAAGLALWLDRQLVLAHATPVPDELAAWPAGGPRARAELTGWPARKALVEVAEATGADLLVAGHRAQGGHLGSTAVALSRTAPCSLLVGRPWPSR